MKKKPSDVARQGDLTGHAQADWKTVHNIWPNVKVYVETALPQIVVDTSTLVVDPVNHRVGVGTAAPAYALDVIGGLRVSTTFACNGATPRTSYSSGGAAPSGGTGATAGAYDTAPHRDAAITLLNNIRTALVNNGIMS